MSQLESKNLVIIGQGYVGLPLAMAAVDSGWTVIGVDTDSAKVELINAGSSPIEDISDEQLKKALSKRLYRATTDFMTVAQASVIAICVPTPLDGNREPDLSLLRNASSRIAPHVSHETLIITESTSYPGTLREVIIPIFDSLKPATANTLFFASAPERVNPGDLTWHQKNTPRLVGAIDAESKTKALSFYESICDYVISVSTPEVAEAAKLLENTFRLVNIAFINEFTQLCSTAGINIFDVIEAASSKPYGFMAFRPGVGVGGHCIPIDPVYLTWWARRNGIEAKFVEVADVINQEMPIYVAKRAMELITKSSSNPRILILGVAYKPGIGDVRESPALKLREYLMGFKAQVGWYDPLVKTWGGTKPVTLEWACDLAILSTNQPGMDLSKILGRGIPILDCTNSLKDHKGVISL